MTARPSEHARSLEPQMSQWRSTPSAFVHGIQLLWLQHATVKSLESGRMVDVVRCPRLTSQTWHRPLERPVVAAKITLHSAVALAPSCKLHCQIALPQTIVSDLLHCDHFWAPGPPGVPFFHALCFPACSPLSNGTKRSGGGAAAQGSAAAPAAAAEPCALHGTEGRGFRCPEVSGGLAACFWGGRKREIEATKVEGTSPMQLVAVQFLGSPGGGVQLPPCAGATTSPNFLQGQRTGILRGQLDVAIVSCVRLGLL